MSSWIREALRCRAIPIVCGRSCGISVRMRSSSRIRRAGSRFGWNVSTRTSRWPSRTTASASLGIPAASVRAFQSSRCWARRAFTGAWVWVWQSAGISSNSRVAGSRHTAVEPAKARYFESMLPVRSVGSHVEEGIRQHPATPSVNDNIFDSGIERHSDSGRGRRSGFAGALPRNPRDDGCHRHHRRLRSRMHSRSFAAIERTC